jgi:hypothetical protein
VTFTVQTVGNVFLNAPADGFYSVFQNQGTFRKTTPGILQTNLVYFFNDTNGPVQVQAGTLSFKGPIDIVNGLITLSPGTVLEVGGDGPELNNLLSGVQGTGTVRFMDSRATNIGAGYNLSLPGQTFIQNQAVVHFRKQVVSLGTKLTVQDSAVADFISGVPVAVGQFKLTGMAMLSGGDEFRITGVGDWDGGKMKGPGATTVVAGGRLNVSGAAIKTLEKRNLKNAATIVWSGAGVFETKNGSFINNEATGTFDIQGDAQMSSDAVTPTIFTNLGTLKKSAGNGTSQIDAAVNNNNTLQVQSGTLLLNGGGMSTGAFTVNAFKALEFGDGIHNLLAGSSVNGPGNVVFSHAGTTNIGGVYAVTGSTTAMTDAKANFDSPVTDVGQTLTIQNNATADFSGGQAFSAANFNLLNLGVLDGTDTLKVTNQAVWSGGAMMGAGVTKIEPGATMKINGGADKTLTGRTLATVGNVTWTGAGNIVAGGGATINNLLGATWDIQNDQTLGGGPAPAATFNNDGTVRKTAGVGTTTISAIFNNDNFVFAEKETLSLSGGGASGGHFDIDNAATIDFSGGVHNLNGASVIQGAGTARVSGAATANINGAVNMDPSTGVTEVNGLGATAAFNHVIQNLGSRFDILNGGIANLNTGATVHVDKLKVLDPAGLSGLGGGDAVVVESDFVWSGGTLGGGARFTLAANAVGHILGGPNRLQRLMEHEGIFRYVVGGITFNADGAWIMEPGALLDITGNSAMAAAPGATPTFINGGKITKTGGAGAASFLGITFTNNGTIDIAPFETIVITTLANLDPATGILAGGTYTVAGKLDVRGNIAVNAATVTLDGAASTIANGAADALANLGTNAVAGHLNLRHGRVLNALGIFRNGGVVTLDATSSLTAARDYVQSAGVTNLGGGKLSADSVDVQNGVLSGPGAITGHLINGGEVSPGAFPGQLTVNGNFTQAATGKLDIKLGGTALGQFDVLQTNGVADLNGTLNVSLVDSFVPSLGNSFAILPFASHRGDFATKNGLALGNSLKLTSMFDPVTLRLVVATDVVNRATTTFVAATAPAVYGNAVIFSAIVIPNPGAGNGTVRFFDNGSPLAAPVALNEASVASVSIPSLHAGSHSITAVYSGAAGFDASPASAAVIQTITPAPLTVAGITASDKKYDGSTHASLNLSAATLVGVLSPDVVHLETSDALADFDTANVGADKPVTISGLRIDNADYTLIQPVAVASITPATTTTTLTATPLATTGGMLVMLSASVAADATGTVTFRDNGTPLAGGANVPLSGGTAVFSTNLLTIGSHPITADYLGSANFTPSSSNTQTLTVSGAATATTLIGNGPNPALATQPLSFTVNVSGGTATDGETVELHDAANANVLVASGVLANGSAAIAVAAGGLSVGPHNLVAVYGGNSFNAASASSPAYAQVVATRPRVLSITPNGNIAALAGPQRSRIASVEVIFDQAVHLDAGALALTLHTGNVQYNGTPQPNGFGSLPTNVALSTTDNVTWIATFDGNTDNGADGLKSLRDGVYDFSVDGALVAPAGVPGIRMTGAATTTFHRLFGDTDAPFTPEGGTPGIDFSSVVNTGDNFAFRTAFNRPAPDFQAALDFDGSGFINTGDNLEFRNRFNQSLTWRA